MGQINLLEDISKLTKIPINILYNISNTAEKDICHTVYQDFIESEKTSISFDIGVGTIILNFNTDDEFISYEFKPSKRLEKEIVKTINNKQDLLTESIESNLKNKVLSLYKELV